MAEIIDKNEKKIADIELAIKLIFEYAGKADLKDEAIMLSTLDLDKAYLTSIKKMIQEQKLTMQNISGYKIKFNRANIKGLEINRSVFPSAEFIEGKLNRVIFDSVLLHSANFFNADLTEICFCNINNVYFDGKLYRLEESSKENTNFKHIRFRKAIMCRAILSGQIFENCNFKEANLSAADLSGAIFRASKGGITLSHDRHKTQGRYEIATFEDANLSDADLSEADMSGARGLTQAQIDEIIFEESNPPTLPDGLIPPANRAYITQKDKDGKTHRYFIKSEAKWSEQSVDEYLQGFRFRSI